MEVIYIILPLAMLMAGVAVTAFFWATGQGQFDDLLTPQHRILFDDEPCPGRHQATISQNDTTL